MGRKNNRADVYEPLDLTSARELGARPGPIINARQAAEDRRKAAMQREARQRDARVNGGIDWSICLVPGCGVDLRSLGRWPRVDDASHDHRARLPLCDEHMAVALMQAKHEADIDHPVIVEALALVLERQKAKMDAEAEAKRKAHLARTDGHIYAVRHNGLIKVGWSRDVHQRIHDYGPDVQVLCVYEGTRDDETYLHRQLKPARARGREWYEDGPILADFVAKAVEQHGEPEVRDYWSRPAAPTPRTHRSSRRRAGP